MRILDSEEIAHDLQNYPHWTGGAESLTRVYTAADFPTAIALVDQVAIVAEAMNHHPDIDVRWKTVRFRLSTHSAGGVTELDLELARRIEEILAGDAP